MIAAKRDEIVPPSAAVKLWEAMGQPKIVWYDTTHYGAALYIPAAFKPIIATLPGGITNRGGRREHREEPLLCALCVLRG